MFPDGAKYEGEFRFGKKSGQGFFFFKSGSRYEGIMFNSGQIDRSYVFFCVCVCH